ncbi:hypothetical protein CGZ98_08895 [Enemella evansiae]|nr:hypothetical protein CGZ98_08895 [Enemella evansiae]
MVDSESPGSNDRAASDRGWRVAVVGSGPSGIYAVQALLKRDEVTAVDVFESLPAPYGLLRYGVAPDHAKTKSVARALARAFDDPRVRFFGNVRVGTTITRQELLEHYDAIVYATGARYDRELGIPGEQLTGSVGAADFVAWYSGHPDVGQPADLSGNRSIVIIGAGNVALDVARISLQDRKILEHTDMPREVVAEIASAPLDEVHLLIRRGPAHVKFSRVELAELLTLPDLRVLLHVDPAEFAERDDLSKEAGVNLKLFREALARQAESDAAGEQPSRTLHVHFWTTPERIEGEHRVSAVRVVTRTPEGVTVEGEIPAQAAIRAIGYRGEPIGGLPFDEIACLVPNEAGAVAAPAEVGREFVTGWIKRGPTGVIGTNKGDAAETVDTLADALGRTPGVGGERPDIAELFGDRGITTVDWSQWRRIEEAEQALGDEHGAPTVKLVDREELLDAARQEQETGLRN